LIDSIMAMVFADILPSCPTSRQASAYGPTTAGIREALGQYLGVQQGSPLYFRVKTVAYYWFSKTTDHRAGRRSQKAMRIMRANE
jgi:hypothetical protein